MTKNIYNIGTIMSLFWLDFCAETGAFQPDQFVGLSSDQSSFPVNCETLPGPRPLAMSPFPRRGPPAVGGVRWLDPILWRSAWPSVSFPSKGWGPGPLNLHPVFKVLLTDLPGTKSTCAWISKYGYTVIWATELTLQAADSSSLTVSFSQGQQTAAVPLGSLF